MFTEARQCVRKFGYLQRKVLLFRRSDAELSWQLLAQSFSPITKIQMISNKTSLWGYKANYLYMQIRELYVFLFMFREQFAMVLQEKKDRF